MTKERAIDLLKNEIKCVSSMCNRDCYICPLAVDEKEKIEALLIAIKALETSEVIYDKAELKRILWVAAMKIHGKIWVILMDT